MPRDVPLDIQDLFTRRRKNFYISVGANFNYEIAVLIWNKTWLQFDIIEHQKITIALILKATSFITYSMNIQVVFVCFSCIT
jgi:hypothetical protein